MNIKATERGKSNWMFIMQDSSTPSEQKGQPGRPKEVLKSKISSQNVKNDFTSQQPLFKVQKHHQK
jgi:hypothetical protein